MFTVANRTDKLTSRLFQTFGRLLSRARPNPKGQIRFLDLVARTLLVAPGITTSSKKLLVARAPLLVARTLLASKASYRLL